MVGLHAQFVRALAGQCRTRAACFWRAHVNRSSTDPVCLFLDLQFAPQDLGIEVVYASQAPIVGTSIASHLCMLVT